MHGVACEVVLTRTPARREGSSALVAAPENILLGCAGIALFVPAIFIDNTFSTFGALLGIAIGLARETAATVAMPDSVIAGATIPYVALSVIVGLIVFCGIGAGLVPVRRAARLDLLQAMATG